MTTEKPITICMVLASRGSGGLEKHFIDLCNGLAPRHNVVAVAAPEFEQSLRGSVTFERINVSRSRHNPLLAIALRRILRRYAPDIVHAQANKAATLVRRATFGLDCKRMATIHNLKSSTGMFAGYDRVIAVSRDVAKRVAGSPVEVVYNGIDPPATGSTAPSGLTRPYIATVGRLVPAKGFDVLLESWTGIDAQLVIAGEGPQRRQLEGLIEKHHLQKTVRMLGHCSNVPELLENASMTVVSSRNEGCGYVFIESLFARTPVISTRVPVANEVLPSRWLARTEDAASLRRLILDGLQHRNALNADMEPAYSFARENFTRERMVDHTVAVYRSVLSDSPPSPADRTGTAQG